MTTASEIRVRSSECLVRSLSLCRASHEDILRPQIAMMCPCIAKWDFHRLLTPAFSGYNKSLVLPHRLTFLHEGIESLLRIL